MVLQFNQWSIFWGVLQHLYQNINTNKNQLTPKSIKLVVYRMGSITKTELKRITQ